MVDNVWIEGFWSDWKQIFVWAIVPDITTEIYPNYELFCKTYKQCLVA